MGGPPWGVPLRYVENSPIFRLDRVTTPLLITHGSLDNAVPVALAEEVFAHYALRAVKPCLLRGDTSKHL